MHMKWMLIISLLTTGVVRADVPAPEARTEGLTLWVYNVGQDMYRLQELVPGQTPNVSKVIERVDLGNKDFGVNDQFLAELGGYITIQQGGRYEFQLNSDDGSELIIDAAW
jgi:hypothetical protein